jgi:long-chain acyl-CoA synthetase
LNFTQLIRGAARRWPDRDAVVTDEYAGSFTELWRSIASAGRYYLDRGIAPRDRILIILPNIPEFLYFHYGALKIGAVSVLVNHEYTWWEVRRIAANCEPSLVISTEAWLSRNSAGLELGVPQVAVETLRSRAPGDDEIFGLPSRATASINYSYFGDGYPKGALLSHANHIYAATGYARHQGFRCEDRLLVILPISHVYALSGCVNSGLIRGGALIIGQYSTPSSILRGLARHRVTIFSCVPGIFELLAEYKNRGKYDLSSLRLLVTGGAFMPEERQKEIEASFATEMVQGYGLTECLPVICNPQGSGNRRGTLGVPGRRDIHVRIVGADARPLPAGSVGQIQLHSTTTMTGYHRLPEDTEAIFDGEWLRTGDVGWLDEEGYLHFQEMTKPIYNVYGNKVDPLEVRRVLLEHPEIEEAELSSEPTEGGRLGEVKFSAKVRPKPGKTLYAEEVRGFCRERLARYKVPQSIMIEE